MEEHLKRTFQEAVEAKKVPGVAAIALDATGEVLFKGAFGTTNINEPSAPPMTSSTQAMLWSCTKLVTTVAALQLVEQGKLGLDDPVHKYVPSIAKVQVLEGFDGDGKPILRPAKTQATVLHLMTHTAGFSYDFFDEPTLNWRLHAQPDEVPAAYVTSGNMAMFQSPLIADPGTKYKYGINSDWLGLVVEAISGMPLNAYVEKYITGPLAMNSSSSHLKDPKNFLIIHHRGDDGSLTANAAIKAADSPDIYGGGHFLYSTLDDYSSFLLTILNKGSHPTSGTRILEEKSVTEYLFADHIHRICSNEGIGLIKTTIPAVSGEGEFLPWSRKGWSCALMLNFEDSPKGRSAGSAAWAGLGNLFYWLDPVKGKLGLIITGVLPFMDKEVLHLFDELERAVYGHEPAHEIEEAKVAIS